MRIGIDCRMYGPKHTGIGRYVQNMVENLLLLDRENEYVLFVRNYENVKCTMYNVKFIEANIPHYSLKEQFLLPAIIKKEKLDLMHFPHFNVPIFYPGKYVVTIHDLIKHSSKGKETTTRTKWIYWLKYLGYKFVFKKTVEKAEKIITPSQFVKSELIKKYRITPEKIVVTYEGVDNSIKYQVLSLPAGKAGIKQGNDEILEKYNIQKPFLLYVGSVYPHKNIERLIKAVKLLNETNTQHLSPITLVIVCARNVFSERLNKYIDQNEIGKFVQLTGFVSDENLAVLYQEAEAFVFPTLSEGFGLPGLEAMSLGCPVICSDIPVLKEVYKDCAVYFDPLNTSDIAGKIKNFLEDKRLQSGLKECGKKLAGTYSWARMASETMDVYNNAK